MNNIPEIDFAIIGGSSTNSISFPEDLKRADVEIEHVDLYFETPYGKSPAFKIFRIEGQRIITCEMHGWRPNEVNRGVASQQVFWVFQQAKVKRVLAEGGVGSINHLLELRDLIVPNDYIDQSMRKDVGLGGPYLLVMRQAICPEMSRVIAQIAKHYVRNEGRHVYTRGTYVNTDGRHFESPAEVQMYRLAQGDMVGQSICPEVYLAREIGACYAGLYMVVNYAEGIIRDWEHQDLKEIFYQESALIGNILLDSVKKIGLNQENCQCLVHRRNTLLTNMK